MNSHYMFKTRMQELDSYKTHRSGSELVSVSGRVEDISSK